MFLEKGLSPSCTKLVLFFLSIGCIYYYIKTGKQGTPIEETYYVQFKNTKFPYKIQTKTVECEDKNVLIAISSAADAFNLRMAFRNEWAKNNISNVIFRFFVGFSKNESVRQACYEESKKYNDLVLTDIFDLFITLVHKTHSIFTWQQNFCPSVKYILKNQDNSLINIPRLLYWIDNGFETKYNSLNGNVIFCRTLEYLDSNMKHKIEGSNNNGFEYCLQFSYLISTKAVNMMLLQAKEEEIIPFVYDIMFTGFLAEKVGAKRIHSPKHFTIASIDTNCGCDENKIPYVFSTRSKWSDNNTLSSDYSVASENFANMSCPKTNNHDIDFFKSCVAHTS